MGKRDLPGELESAIIVAFVTERGFVYEKTEGSHMIYRRPGYPHISIPKRGVATRQPCYVLNSVLKNTGTKRSQFVKWYRNR